MVLRLVSDRIVQVAEASRTFANVKSTDPLAQPRTVCAKCLRFVHIVLNTVGNGLRITLRNK